MSTLAELLAQSTREGTLYDDLPDGRLRCYACGHRCPLPEGAVGVCKVRFNQHGRLRMPWGYVGGVQCDPIGKKPFFHAYPGALAYSFGMLGCDLHRSYCQNWVTSQALRDSEAVKPPLEATPEGLVCHALRQDARVIVSTYNEPLITSEWAVAVFKEAKAAGLVTGYVSNGNGTSQVLEYLRPWVDLYKVDLKSFDDRRYHELGGRLEPILDTIRHLHAMGFWVEIVTLLIPGFNDHHDELQRLTSVRCGRVARHPMARHGISRGLHDDRPGQHHGCHAARRGSHRSRERIAARVCGQSARPCRRARTQAVRRLRRPAHRPRWLRRAGIQADGQRAVPRMRRTRSRPLGRGFRRANHGAVSELQFATVADQPIINWFQCC